MTTRILTLDPDVHVEVTPHTDGTTRVVIEREGTYVYTSVLLSPEQTAALAEALDLIVVGGQS